MKKSVRLTESAIMVSLAFVLGMLKIIDMPFGGSVTAFSMLPLAIIAYRHRTVWGLFVGFVYGILDMILGLKNLTYATGAAAVAAIIILDYLLAFTVIGFSGIFRGKFRRQGTCFALGAFVACVMRYVCHVIVGCTVWAGVSIPTSDGLLFSMVYNAAYMVPETLMLVVAAYFAGEAFTISESEIKRTVMPKTSLVNLYSSIPVSLGVVISFVMIFALTQSEEGFDITLIGTHDVYKWLPIITVFAVGVLLSVIIRTALRYEMTAPDGAIKSRTGNDSDDSDAV